VRHYENAQRAVCGNASGAPARMNFRLLTGGSGGGSSWRCRCQHVLQHSSLYHVVSCTACCVGGWLAQQATAAERSGLDAADLASTHVRRRTPRARAQISISQHARLAARCAHMVMPNCVALT
jgi:hypothetical protein